MRMTDDRLRAERHKPMGVQVNHRVNGRANSRKRVRRTIWKLIISQPNFLLFFWDKAWLCSPGWQGTCYADRAGFELPAIFLPLTIVCWDDRPGFPHLDSFLCFLGAQANVHLKLLQKNSSNKIKFSISSEVVKVLSILQYEMFSQDWILYVKISKHFISMKISFISNKQ